MSLPSIFEYLPECAPALCKLASEEPQPEGSRAGRVARIAGKGLLGFGLGTLAGAGAASLADKLHAGAGGQSISIGALQRAAPYVGGAAGLAYNLYKAKELEELRRAAQPDVPPRRLPGE